MVLNIQLDFKPGCTKHFVRLTVQFNTQATESTLNDKQVNSFRQVFIYNLEM